MAKGQKPDYVVNSQGEGARKLTPKEFQRPIRTGTASFMNKSRELIGGPTSTAR